jgi:hypothetical protein
MTLPSPVGWLRLASAAALVGLAFMLWSLFDPRVQPVLIALSVGQGIGTLSLLVFVWVVVSDYRKRRRPDDPTKI